MRSIIWDDLVGSGQPLIVAGYSSISQVVEFVAAWLRKVAEGQVRIALGSEPFDSAAKHFLAPDAQFTEEVRGFWLEEGISLRLSGKIVQVLQAIDTDRLAVRAVAGDWTMHAKIYVGDQAATVGSSNFTRSGLARQIEANARFDADTEGARYRQIVQVAENYWGVGEDWTAQFRELLRDLLRFVEWREALARACADLLEGTWAERYLPKEAARQSLWPSQMTGIAQALWVIENVGSVLVADATGSGKTRMGAHLVRAVRDRLFQTGRARKDLAVLVGPPPVLDTWRREALDGGLSLHVISHGKLSRTPGSTDAQYVQEAQILALDESHMFINARSNRTKIVANNAADHVVLLTATPISKGATDLLSLVQLLGPDNFDDATIDTLRDLERRPNADIAAKSRQLLRAEIARFTVRRTKSMFNAMVDLEPDAYRDSATGRINKYPVNAPLIYNTAETETDCELAREIRAQALRLRGLVNLGRRVARPVGFSRSAGDDQVLAYRMGAAGGLARFNVTDAMRSSRAALIEHVAGTDEAVRAEGMEEGPPKSDSGDILTKVRDLIEAGPPTMELDCRPPEWLASTEEWRSCCEEELNAYQAILSLAGRLSDAREQGKAALIAEAHLRHPRLIAFDRHPITLAVLKPLVEASISAEVYLATGSTSKGKKEVGTALDRDSKRKAIALCSDAMSEGVNLQGASCIVHLDFPTTLRVAEQRVGRVDRMNSPYDTIESYWPRDGDDFRTRAAERLAQRAQTSADLIGSNIDLPDLQEDDSDRELMDVDKAVAAYANPDAEPWDGILDALAPVRELVTGSTALIPAAVYQEYRTVTERVVSRVSPVESDTPFAFIAVAGTQHGAPHWLLLESSPDQDHTTIGDVVDRLRVLLADDPPALAFDDTCDQYLAEFLDRAANIEHQLLPRRLRKAVDHMAEVTLAWREAALGRGDIEQAQRWKRLSDIAAPEPGSTRPDPYLVGQAWFDLVAPYLAEQRQTGRSQLVRLRDITAVLHSRPLDTSVVEEAMAGIGEVPDIDTRISACILGVPHGRN